MRPLLSLLLALLLPAAACGPGDGGVRDGAAAQLAADSAGTPAPTVGLDSATLAEVFASAARLPRLHSLLVARHGEVQEEAYYRGRTPQGRANIKSASKSVLSALVGIAVAEGKLRLDQPIAPFFSAHLAGEKDPRKREITVANLLSMQSGLEPTSFGNYGAWVSSPNWVRYAITRPMVDSPGGRMLYSTGSTHLLSAILTRATGMSTHAYAREKLAKPLGIELRPWSTDPQGIYFGGNEMRMTPREMFRFGELYRNGGLHDGKRILSEEWIRESWTPRTVSPYNGHRYGYGWWIRQSRGHAVYFAWGYGGQFVFVVPELELTVVMTSESETPREGGHLGALHGLLDQVVDAAR